MTRHRPTNRKPKGMNKSLGNSLQNERDRNRKKHKIAVTEDDIDNPAFMEEEIDRALESKMFETNMEELFAKAELAGTSFNAERGGVQIVDKDSTVVVRTKADLKDFNILKETHGHLLKIPRRPDRLLYNTADELHALENELFLNWRLGMSQLEECDGVVLTPFERNPDIWRELWRVVERSDLVVQIVDARNPLLFRSADLEDYVVSVDPAKKNVLLINKADLLLPEQQHQWAKYFVDHNIDAIFWSALDETKTIKEEEENVEESDESDEEASSSGEEAAEEDKDSEAPESTDSRPSNFVSNRDELLSVLRERGGRVIPGGRPLVIGFVGYPNVGKSSTINKLIGTKKVTVSATPGKTKRLQTIILDDEVTLCDCPGLVMPSFAFDKNEMFLNSIMPVEQMRDHFGPTNLLLSRIPALWIADRYQLTLPDKEITSVVLLTAIAFMRGLMSSSGVPDCSRAARLIVKEVVCGNILWVAAPPTLDQSEFDSILFPAVDQSKQKGAAQLRMMERRGLIETSDTSNKRFDDAFFAEGGSQAHITFFRPGVPNTGAPTTVGASKKHFKKKDKIRRIFVGTYA